MGWTLISARVLEEVQLMIVLGVPPLTSCQNLGNNCLSWGENDVRTQYKSKAYNKKAERLGNTMRSRDTVGWVASPFGKATDNAITKKRRERKYLPLGVKCLAWISSVTRLADSTWASEVVKITERYSIEVISVLISSLATWIREFYESQRLLLDGLPLSGHGCDKRILFKISRVN